MGSAISAGCASSGPPQCSADRMTPSSVKGAAAAAPDVTKRSAVGGGASRRSTAPAGAMWLSTALTASSAMR